MFGLAPRAKTIRIETRARNAVSLLPDAGGAARASKIAAGGPSAITLARAGATAYLRRPALDSCAGHTVRTTPGVIFAIICAGGQPSRRPESGSASRRFRPCPAGTAARRGQRSHKPHLSAADLDAPWRAAD